MLSKVRFVLSIQRRSDPTFLCLVYGWTHNRLDSVHGKPPLACVFIAILVLSGSVLNRMQKGQKFKVLSKGPAAVKKIQTTYQDGDAYGSIGVDW